MGQGCLKTFLLSVGFIVVAGMVSPAQAAIFTDFVDFAPGDNFQTVSDASAVALRSWTHNILDELAPLAIERVIVNDARLAFRYSKTEGNEHWFLNLGLGDLRAIGTNPLTIEFLLGPEALTDLKTDGLITFTASENTVGNDTFRRFDATLRGNYTLKQTGPEMPEPVSAALMGLGITVFFLLRTLKNIKTLGLFCRQ